MRMKIFNFDSLRNAHKVEFNFHETQPAIAVQKVSAEKDINVTLGMSRLRVETIYFDKETNSMYFGWFCERME